MAITLLNRPANFGRVNDTNRLAYQFYSNKYTESNFNFQFQLTKWNVDGTSIDLGSYNLYPNSGGTAEFNPFQVYKNYVSYDFDASITGMTAANNSFGSFSLSCYEYYGVQNLYTAYAALTTYSYGNTCSYSGVNYVYINMQPTSETSGRGKPNAEPNYFAVTTNTIAPPSRRVDGGQWTGEVGSYSPSVYYNGCTPQVPYDYLPLNGKGNSLWVMSGATNGQFLTDTSNMRLGNDGFAYLYFLADNASRPTAARYTIYYNCMTSSALPDGPNYIGGIQQFENSPSLSPMMPTGGYNIITTGGNGTSVTEPQRSGICTAVYYQSGFTYGSVNQKMFYFPCGPYQLIHYVPNSALSGRSNTWIYYKIDLMKNDTVLSANPVYIFRNETCNKYGKTVLTWLNPHGGFDSMEFNKKSIEKIKVKRDTYKQRPLFSYSPYTAGEKVFSTEVTESITLQTDLMTQTEAQLLYQLISSPKVYMIKQHTYNGNNYPYGIPVIVDVDEYQYQKKVNDKEVFSEVTVRYANDKIVQSD